VTISQLALLSIVAHSASGSCTAAITKTDAARTQRNITGKGHRFTGIDASGQINFSVCNTNFGDFEVVASKSCVLLVLA